MTWGIIHLMFFVAIGMRDAAIGDDHICTSYEEYLDTVPVQEWIPVKKYKTEWCFNIPPRCSKQYTTYKSKITKKTVVKQRIVQKCCDGYVKLETGHKCIPVCSALCLHGKCIAPESCSCDSGYYGHRCDKLCDIGYWGEGCLKSCDCENDSICDAVHGVCHCSDGWQGVRCDVPCSVGRYGKGCEFWCSCERCDHVTGKCEETTVADTTTTTSNNAAALTDPQLRDDHEMTESNQREWTESATTESDQREWTESATTESDQREWTESATTESDQREWTESATTESDQREWTGNATTDDSTIPWEPEGMNGTAFPYDGNVTEVTVTEDSDDEVAVVENLFVVCGVVVSIFFLIMVSVVIAHCRKMRKIYGCNKGDVGHGENFPARRFSSETVHPVDPVFDAATCATAVDLVTEKPRMLTFKPVQRGRSLGERASGWPEGEQSLH